MADTGLRREAVGLREVLFQSITDMAPGAAIAASIPAGVAFAGLLRARRWMARLWRSTAGNRSPRLDTSQPMRPDLPCDLSSARTRSQPKTGKDTG